MVPAAATIAPPSFDRSFILLEEEVQELLASTAALEADLKNVEQQVEVAERRRVEAAARRKNAEEARERHVAELEEAQEELRAGTWQPAGGVTTEGDAEPLPPAATVEVSVGTTSVSLAVTANSEAPSTRGGAASGDAPTAAAGVGDATAGVPLQPLTQRQVNERCRGVLRLLRDISEVSAESQLAAE